MIYFSVFFCLIRQQHTCVIKHELSIYINHKTIKMKLINNISNFNIIIYKYIQ